MKLARLSSLLREITTFGTRNGPHSNSYSSNAMLSHRSVRPSEGSRTELFRRISPIGDSKISILPILDQWVEEGRPVDERILKRIIRDLRCYKRYRHALEVSIWMTNKRYSNLASVDVVIRLGLITKAVGIERAEIYFNNVPQELKDLEVYNRMLVLYYKTGNMEKFNALLQEMEENDIVCNNITFSIQLSAYASVMDIGGMDKVVTLMESDPKVVCGWYNFAIAAAGYINAGLLDKALEMLKKAEARVPTKGCPGYGNLLIQYATIGRKDEVLRVWSLYQKKGKIYNMGYECMLKSLVKLGDLEIAEKILDEWESQDLTYTVRIPNIMIGAYCRNGLFEKAETLIDRVISKGERPDAWIWCCFSTGYFQYDQPEKAVEMLKRAIVLCEALGKQISEYLAACLEHLKGVGDMEEVEGFIKYMSDKSIISLDIQEKVLNAIKAKESAQNGAMLALMEPEEK
ncbi:pentatricopeptide repeat-containing protein At2g20710, mitochondrial-like [Euphorbia lathyris]|uniref:pentatricopeptide repeat-containing protein At2g20710, mitochondrial-like n=1 Tax=Euphorbia lathyris TaxID=212925 RepID=UPI003313D181